MLYPERMHKVTIVAPKLYLKDIIGTLYQLKALHIEAYTKKELPLGTPLKDAETFASLLLDIQFIKSHLALAPGRRVPQRMKAVVAQARRTVADSVGGLQAVDEEMRLLASEKEELLFLQQAGIKNTGVVSSYEKLEMLAGYASDPTALQSSDITAFYSRKAGASYPVVLFFRKGKDIRETVLRKGFIERPLTLRGTGTIERRLQELEAKKKMAAEKQAVLKSKLKAVEKKYGNALGAIEQHLLAEISKAEAPLKFASSEYTFIVQGFVPRRNATRLVSELERITRNLYLKVEEEEHAPTLISNPGPIKSFEFFLRMYSLPRYNEIDPSFLIFITFPVFYGIMLGDIGYGLVLLGLGLFLRTRKKHALIDITIISALSTMVFGVVYGEFFGTEQLLGYELNPVLHRLAHTKDIIMLSIFIGLVHLTIGFMFGFVNELGHSTRHALAKLSWIGLQYSIIFYLLDAAQFLTVGFTDQLLVVFAAAALLTVALEGAFAAFEIPTLIGNVFSYARLAAIGLASASLAIVVNDAAGMLFGMGGIFMALAAVVIVVGHVFNLALGILDSFIQSLRLHYVELFTKFYKGAGKEYKPFG